MSSKEKLCTLCARIVGNTTEMSYIEDDQTDLCICENCVKSMYLSIKHSKESEPTSRNTPPAPKDIFNHISKYVIGQDEAKKTFSIAVAHHYRRINSSDTSSKSNIMIVGPSGSGKTEMARSVASFLKVPFVQIDVTTLTPRGYVGESVDVCIERLLGAAGGDPKLAENGIVFLDEIDKLPNGGDQTHFRSKSVQQELLRLVEGDVIEIKMPDGKEIPVNTSKILFIAAGAFVGLNEVVKTKDSKQIGITNLGSSSSPNDDVDWRDLLESEHLVQYGFIPEFIGRFPVVTATRELTRENLITIMKEPENSILRQYQSLVRMDNVNLEFSDEFLGSVADKALADKVGARGLRKQIEVALKNFFFEIDRYKSKTVVIRPGGLIEVKSSSPKKSAQLSK